MIARTHAVPLRRRRGAIACHGRQISSEMHSVDEIDQPLHLERLAGNERLLAVVSGCADRKPETKQKQNAERL